jgi:hypothetical protein
VINAEDLVAKFRHALDNNWGYIWGTSGVLWTQARQQQLNQTTDSDREMGRKYGAKWIGHYVADCSGLFRWAFKQLGSDIAHGSNSIYDRYCSSHGKMNNGKRTDGGELKIGMALFTGTDKNRNHIGLYVGNGKIIEAKGTIAGVIESDIADKRWTWWGELKDVLYEGADPEPAPAPASYPTLRQGDSGDYVTIAQNMLKARGYNLGQCGVDGKFGKATAAAVRTFQRDWGLEQDGIIGPMTWKMLLSSPAKEKTYSVTVTGLDLTQAKALCNTYMSKASMKEE